MKIMIRVVNFLCDYFANYFIVCSIDFLPHPSSCTNVPIDINGNYYRTSFCFPDCGDGKISCLDYDITNWLDIVVQGEECDGGRNFNKVGCLPNCTRAPGMQFGFVIFIYLFIYFVNS
jgi:hypothetical protein